jgi:hypothetical protein
MKRHKVINRFLTVLIVLTALVYFSCEKKAEDSRQTQEEVTSETISPDSTSSVATEGEPGTENTIQIPDMKGVWSGTFDKRATTLTITEQTDSSFSGKISISYREVINQEVKGTFSPTSLKITMTDQLHSRYEGTYNGKLSKELNNFSGTFTMKVDGSKFSFNLNKK